MLPVANSFGMLINVNWLLVSHPGRCNPKGPELTRAVYGLSHVGLILDKAFVPPNSPGRTAPACMKARTAT